MVMGKQQNYAGLCNAIMMASPDVNLLNYGNNNMKNILNPRGNESSIRLPLILANKYPHLITVLEPACFFTKLE